MKRGMTPELERWYKRWGRDVVAGEGPLASYVPVPMPPPEPWGRKIEKATYQDMRIVPISTLDAELEALRLWIRAEVRRRVRGHLATLVRGSV